MAQSKSLKLPNVPQNLWNLAFRLVSSDWAALILKTWQLVQQLYAEQVVGLYEVLDFDHTLELCDAKGKKAVYKKQMTIRFLQDFVSAYQDQAWGLGNIFAAYKCSPGVPVDRYREGNKHRVLISLRETKRRGETMKIKIDRTVTNGFSRSPGWSETEISHRTNQLRTSVIFPKKRPPKSPFLLQKHAGQVIPLGPEHIEPLPDGRQCLFWETNKPVLFETYILKWTW